MKISRPEFYANKQLKEALSIHGTSKDDIHDIRVAVRKYTDVLTSLYPVYQNQECLSLAKDSLKVLGRVRDMDICEIKGRERDELALKAIKRVRKLSICYLPKVYGSRLLVYNAIIKDYKKIQDISDFHELRKIVRRVRNLTESLGYENTPVKDLAKKMGDLRDNTLKYICKGLTPPPLDVNVFKEEAKKAIVKILLSQDEFHHFL